MSIIRNNLLFNHTYGAESERDDQIVYKLYGLTEEEIAIVEGRTKEGESL